MPAWQSIRIIYLNTQWWHSVYCWVVNHHPYTLVMAFMMHCSVTMGSMRLTQVLLYTCCLSTLRCIEHFIYNGAPNFVVSQFPNVFFTATPNYTMIWLSCKNIGISHKDCLVASQSSHFCQHVWCHISLTGAKFDYLLPVLFCVASCICTLILFLE